MSFTIMTYNIERGFHTTNHILEKERLDAAKRIVKQIKPDFLAITEACYGIPNSHNILMDYQSLFDYPHSCFGAYPVFGPRKGDEGGNCFLSRHAMNSYAVKLQYKGAVRSHITIDGTVLTIDLIHPSYSVSDREKISTLMPLLSTRQEPYILTGDFNTIHPCDQYDWKALYKSIAKSSETKLDVIKTWQNPEFIPHLTSLGLKDAFPEEKRASTVPTLHENPTDRTGVRIDFFFISKQIKVLDAYVLKNDDAEIASDHYPIVGVFDIK